jgi:hypothetical protein
MGSMYGISTGKYELVVKIVLWLVDESSRGIHTIELES